MTRLPLLASRPLAALLLGLALLAPACNVVTSVEPLGSTPVAADPVDWDGTWLHAEGTVHIKVLDAAAGRLSMLTVDDSNDGLEATRSEVQLRRHGDWTFANVVNDEQPGVNYWVRIRLEGNQLIAWFPDPVRFAGEVRGGHLPGSVDESGNVELEPLTAAQLARIVAGEGGILVDWEQPLAFIRISDKAGI